MVPFRAKNDFNTLFTVYNIAVRHLEGLALHSSPTTPYKGFTAGLFGACSDHEGDGPGDEP
jgi:hypothetical protein